ncbi:hypothetical protein evm_005169 [Chilo suppressalis]|nr:hypothetical protein evm_005169 [Chilo suppressalis]
MTRIHCCQIKFSFRESCQNHLLSRKGQQHSSAVRTRRREWLHLICRDDLEHKPKYTSYLVCEKHFNVEDIRQSLNRKLLKKNALPSLMLPSTVPRGPQKEDKHTQTDLSIKVDNCTQTENAANESYAQTSTSPSGNTPRKRKLKAKLLKCRKKKKTTGK